MQYKLLKNSISGRKGQMIELDDKTAKMMARVGLIRMDEPVTVTRQAFDMTGAAVVQTKVVGPDIVKVTGPEVKKRRGRPPKKAADASDTAD